MTITISGVYDVASERLTSIRSSGSEAGEEGDYQRRSQRRFRFEAPSHRSRREDEKSKVTFSPAFERHEDGRTLQKAEQS